MPAGTYAVACGIGASTGGSVTTYSPLAVDKRWTTCPGGSGSVTLTSMTKSRIRGNFQLALVPDSQYPNTTGTRTVSGLFDIPF